MLVGAKTTFLHQRLKRLNLIGHQFYYKVVVKELIVERDVIGRKSVQC